MFDKSSNPANPQWEKQTIQKVLLEHITEQRRARRWSIFFKLVVLGLVGILFYQFFDRELPQPVITSMPHTAIIEITGEIGPGAESDADNIRDSLHAAFENKQVKGVILRINSPGGSPVQARQIYSEVRSLRAQYPQTLIYAVIEDLGTSAAYLIASATDAIYCDKTSLVGSIGVKIDSFGFVDVMHKVGVERRLYVAGKYKGILDPYLPSDPTEDAFIHSQLDIVHKAFIDNVKEGRGTRLRNSPDLFTGLFWSGESALSLGLVDGFGDAQFVASELIKAENLVDYTPSENLLDRIARRVGASIGNAVSTQVGLTQKGVR